MTWLWQVMRPIAVAVIRPVFRVKVVGRKFIPKKGAAILASNHLSALDHVVLPMATRRTIINISKVEHFTGGKVKAWFMRQWGVIPVVRGSGDSSAMDAARKALADGNLFCIYPEGTRSTDGRLHKGHTGVARLALEMKVPVVPCAMVGTFEAKPKGGKTRYFTKTAAVIGPPLDFSAHWGQHNDKAVCRKVTDEVMRAIAAVSGQEYVDEYQFNPEVRTHAHPATSAKPADPSVVHADEGKTAASRIPAPAAPAKRASGSRKTTAKAPKAPAKKVAKPTKSSPKRTTKR